MKNKTNLLLTVVIITGVLMLNMETQQGEATPSVFQSLSLTDQNAIVIASDGDFTTENGVVSGNGSAKAPYIIEGWNISVSGTHGIDIRGTTAHFIVRNNWITTGSVSDPSGIYIHSAASGTATIENNTLVNNSVGIATLFSNNILIANNTCLDNLNQGIRIYSSHEALVLNNSCFENSHGVYASFSLNVTIFDNSLSSNKYFGVYADHGCHDMNVTKNYLLDNNAGVSARGIGSIIHNNTINNNLNEGIYAGGENMTISFNTANNNSYGIRSSRDNVTIINNTFLNNRDHGIERRAEIDTVIANNTIVKGGYYISMSPDALMDATVENNTINGLPLGWLKNLQDLTLSGTAEEYGQIYLMNSSNIIIENINYSEMYMGVYLVNSTNCIIRDSTFEQMGNPIKLDDTDNCQIINNELSNTSDNGIFILSSEDLLIEGNKIQDTLAYAISLDLINNTVIENNFISDAESFVTLESGGSNNLSILNNVAEKINSEAMTLYDIEHCTISNNVIKGIDDSDEGIYTDEAYNLTIEENFFKGFEIGMELGSGSFNLIVNNIIVDSFSYGIEISGDNNTFYHNFFINNNNGSVQAEDTGDNNTWYDSIALEGNYWFDWNGTGNYSIDGSANTFDLYPLAFDLSLEHYVTVNIEFGTLDNEIEWTVTSSLLISGQTPMDYKIFKNGSEVAYGTINDTNEIIYTAGGAEIGTFNYTILITDYLNNTITDIAIVKVQDTINPLIDSPSDLTFEEGETGNAITWTATDLDSNTFILYTNGIEVTSPEWVSGTPIEINIDDLTAGTYNFTIVVFDGSGNSISDTVIVTVTTSPTGTSSPTITVPSSDPKASSGFLFMVTILSFTTLGSFYRKKK